MQRHKWFTWAIIGWAVVTHCQAESITLPKAGVNVGPYRYYGATFPFTRNLAKSPDRWRSNIQQVPIPLTKNGFPAWLSTGQSAYAYVIHNGGRFAAGNYALNWSGTGQVTLNGGSGVTELPFGAANQKRYKIGTNHGNYLRLNILATSPSDPVHDIQIHLLEAGAEDPDMVKPAGTTDWFRPGYLTYLQDFGVVRFMDWGRTNNHPIGNWPSRVTMNSAFWGGDKGIPYELQIELCNRLEADMWVTVPHAADDAYVVELAELIRDNLDSQLRVWVEYSNEVWNTQFSQHAYVRDALTGLYGLSSSYSDTIRAYGHRASNVFTSFQQVFGPLNQHRVVRVICGQAANSSVLGWAIEGLETTGQQADICAIAPYFTKKSVPPNRQARGMSELYEEYMSTGTVNLDNLQASMHDDILEMRSLWEQNFDVAASHHNACLVAYEAGQHLVPHLLVTRTTNDPQSPRWIDVVGDLDGEIDDEFVELIVNFNRDQRMAELYETFIDQWTMIGGKTIVFYYDMGDPSEFGMWGLSPDKYDTNTVKYNVVKQYATSP